MTTITTRAGKGSALTHQELDDNFTNLNTDKADTATLATVATSGSYTDLTDRPTIPTHTSNLTNDSGFVTSQGNAFATIAVAGQSTVSADSATDTLTLVAGTNISLTTDASTDSITIAATGGGNYDNANVAAYLPTHTGNISGGNITATGQVAGTTLRSTQSSGDEGGQIDLALAATNTTLSGGVAIDINQNRLRIFETGGTNRGAYIDLTAATDGVGTNLLAGGGGGGSPGGANTQIQFNDGGSFAGNAVMTFDKATGNVTLGNIRIQNTNVWMTNPGWPQANATFAGGRYLFGAGNAGSFTSTADDIGQNMRNSRMVVFDRFTAVDNGFRKSMFSAVSLADLNGATTYGANNLSRVGSINGDVILSNGVTTNSQFNMFRGVGGVVWLGTAANVGNVSVSTAAGVVGAMVVQAGSNIGTAVGVASGMTNNTNTANTFANTVGYMATFSGSSTNALSWGNVSVLTNPPPGTLTVNSARAATNYYFLNNLDDVAQCRLGSLRRFTEFRHTVAIASGAITIDKTQAQVQYVDVTENITSVTFSGFQASISDSVNTDQQADTVTIIFRQDSTGRTITLPTGTGYRYAGGSSTMTTTANAVQLVSVTAITTASGSGTEYLITISPEFL